MQAFGDLPHHAVIEGLLASVRRQTDVDVAYLTEYGPDGACVRAAAGDGDRLAWDAPDRVGAFAAVPVHLPDGQLFGALCVANHEPIPLLGSATQQFLAAISDVVADQLDQAALVRVLQDRERDQLLGLLDDDRMRTVLQPIVDLRTGGTLGVEALTRVDASPRQSPDRWFAAAARHDLGTRMEAHAIACALPLLEELPRGWYLSVNASPALVESGALDRLLPAADAGRLVVEITEHAAVTDYGRLTNALGRLRSAGVRLAVDDAGAGFSTLRHVLELRPDIIKVDGSLVRGIDVRPLHRAMAESILGFAERGGTTVVAEAIETPSELRALQDLGFPAGQGHLFAAPGPPEDLRTTYPVTAPAPRSRA